MSIKCQRRSHCRHVTNVPTRLGDPIISNGTGKHIRRARRGDKRREIKYDIDKGRTLSGTKEFIYEGGFFFLL